MEEVEEVIEPTTECIIDCVAFLWRGKRGAGTTGLKRNLGVGSTKVKSVWRSSENLFGKFVTRYLAFFISARLKTEFLEFLGEIGSSTTFLLGARSRFGRAIQFNNCLLSKVTIVSYAMWYILRMLWLVVAKDLLEYRHMDAIMGNLFYLFWWTWRAVLKMFARLFRIRQVKGPKNV